MYKAEAFLIGSYFYLDFSTMSEPSISVSEATIIDATSNMDINYETPAGSNTPLPTNKLSNKTLHQLEQARESLAKTTEANNSKKRGRSKSPEPGPSKAKK